MSSVSVPSPYSKRLLFLKKFEPYPLYRSLLFFCSAILLLFTLMSVRSFADKYRTKVYNYVPKLSGISSYLVASCDKESDNDIRYRAYVWWSFKCQTLFLEPVVNGKPLKKYAHTYQPAKYCPSPDKTAVYQMKMSPAPYTVVRSCIP